MTLYKRAVTFVLPGTKPEDRLVVAPVHRVAPDDAAISEERFSPPLSVEPAGSLPPAPATAQGGERATGKRRSLSLYRLRYRRLRPAATSRKYVMKMTPTAIPIATAIVSSRFMGTCSAVVAGFLHACSRQAACRVQP